MEHSKAKELQADFPHSVEIPDFFFILQQSNTTVAVEPNY
jgi:hypothetical protein